MTEHSYKQNDRVRRIADGWPGMGTEARLLGESNEGVWRLVWFDADGDAREDYWRETSFEPLSSPELKEADRVRHDTLGEGTVDFVREKTGIASVLFDVIDGRFDVKTPSLVALNLLTKVEPEQEDEPIEWYREHDGSLLLKSVVMQAIGAVSMCWSERPTGIFDSGRAEKIGNAVMAEITKAMDEPRRTYPFDEGNVTVLGPECFVLRDGSVLSWKGVNYVPQSLLFDTVRPSSTDQGTVNTL